MGGKKWKHVEIAPREVCRDANHLEVFLQDVIDKGGEGIILRDASEQYHPGRARGYLKHKVSTIFQIPLSYPLIFFNRNSEMGKQRL